MFNVIYQEKDGRKKSLDFYGRVLEIGRDKKSDFHIKSMRVSKNHATISFDPETGCVVTDNGSRTGTWVNSSKISTPVSITDDDEVIVGDIRIWVRADSTVNASQTSSTYYSSEKNTAAESVSNLQVVDSGPVVKDSPIEKDVEPTQAETALNEESLSEESEQDDDIHRWGALVHERLLKQMDLRRKEVHKMTDVELRTETDALVSDIIEKIRKTLPDELDIEQLKQTVLNEAVGLGPLEKFLADDSISEIMVNSHDEVFIEKSGRLTKSKYSFSSPGAVLSVIERIITPIGRRIDESSPMVDARLKDGSRVNAVIPPLALKGPSITIRKFSKKKLTFRDLYKFGSVSEDMVKFLELCVHYKKNIIVSGGTGSGKTTLLNVLSNNIPDNERIVTIEDAAELKLNQPNLVALEAKPPNLEGKGAIPIRDLVKNSLRMRPDRIVVGECRGGEALDMLQAMNTGHDGSLTTAHANSPRDMLSRLEVMVLMSGMSLPTSAIREQIASAVDLIVQQTRYPCGTRKISRVSEVVGVESGTIQLQDIFIYNRKGYGEDGRVRGDFEPTGFIPSFYEELGSSGVKLDLSIFKKAEAQYE